MNTETPEFRHFFLRNLDKLIAEIEAFPSEESLWHTAGDVTNPAGTLALHIAGNLQHFVGALLGHTGYVRDRDREFSARYVPRADILAGLHTTRNIVDQVLGQMDDQRCGEVYPSGHFGENRSIRHALLQLLSHLNYHLGQVNYLRRL